ncbi:MAG: hypothetical protein C5B53_01695 [Candidatus Melainabacteria bacterium]|nr:MAG: hypothetical protein C5B53_01695 [Candidatus Melainabacteria bacterium]
MKSFQAKSYLFLLVIGVLGFLIGNARGACGKATSEPIAALFAPYPPMVTPVRIGIATRASRARVAVWAPGAVFVDNRPVFTLNPRSVYSIVGNTIEELATGKSYSLPLNQRAELSAGNYIFWANNRWYRGSLEIISFPHAVTLINVLDLEDYLRGVVPSEMPANWHFEALKAQAVAARSYAWAHMGPGSKWSRTEGFDLVPDVRDQMYRGLAAEARTSSAAVFATRGVVLKDADRVVKPGFYRATVGDAYENLNIRKYTVSDSLLEKITGVPKIVGVTIRQWDPQTGNAHSLQVMGASKKNREVSGVELARMLHFATAGILDVHDEGEYWTFTCRGPGNGSRGLSQHGANMLASKGWRFDQILQQYYQSPDGHVKLGLTDSESMLRYKINALMAAKKNKQASEETTDETQENVHQ